MANKTNKTSSVELLELIEVPKDSRTYKAISHKQ